MNILLNLLVTAAALWVTTLVVPGIRIESSVTGFLMVAVVFGLVNAFVRPVARLLALPIRIMTLGIFTFVINALMLMLTDWLAGNAMSIEGDVLTQLVRALIGSVVISVASTLIGWVIPGKD